MSKLLSTCSTHVAVQWLQPPLPARLFQPLPVHAAPNPAASTGVFHSLMDALNLDELYAATACVQPAGLHLGSEAREHWPGVRHCCGSEVLAVHSDLLGWRLAAPVCWAACQPWGWPCRRFRAFTARSLAILPSHSQALRTLGRLKELCISTPLLEAMSTATSELATASRMRAVVKVDPSAQQAFQRLMAWLPGGYGCAGSGC